MKKVILCLLLLIPILVILTIDASGKLITSALVDIPAESVLIKHGGEVLESEEVYLEEYKDTGKKFTIFCEVFPGIATDEMLWESSNTSIATVVPAEDRKDAAEVHFHDYGSVDIICTSKKNSSITARATLYVGGLIPGYMHIGDFDKESISEITIPRYAVKGVVANVKPARSVMEEKVAWSSSNTDVAEVDNNGVIKAKSYGTATVTATVTAKGKTVSASVTVTVNGDALSREAVIYTTAEHFDLSPYKTDEQVTVEGGDEADLTGVTDFDALPVTFRKGEETQTVYVVRIPSAASLVIENYYALKEGALAAYIALGTSNIELNAITPDGVRRDVVWNSSDENVISFKGNRLYAVGSGEAEIYPSAAGYASQRIKLNVTSPVEDFRLFESAERDKVGLLQERVFGNMTYKDGGYSNTFRLKIASTSPANAAIDAFTFESANTDIATVDHNGVVHFASDVEGKNVTISATAYNQQGVPIRKAYTFHLVNGVNVGVDTASQIFDASKGEKPDFVPYRELKEVAGNRSVKCIVLHNDVYLPSAADGGDRLRNLSASIYGNGKKIDGQFLINSTEEPDKMILWELDKFTDMPKDLRVNFINLNLQSTQPTSDDAQKAFDELSAKVGGAIGVLGGYVDPTAHFSLYVKGCLFQYAYGHVANANGEAEYDGCIFRNNSASAIVLQQSSYGRASVKVKNCIFSNTIAPVGIACGNFNDIIARSTGKKGVAPQFGTFALEGTNYVYNWKRLAEVQMSLLPKGLANDSASSWVDVVNEKLGKIIQESFMMSTDEHLYIEDMETYNAITKEVDRMDFLQKNAWLNFSFLMIGIWENMDPVFNPESFTDGGINVHFDAEQCKALEVNAEVAPSVREFLGLAQVLGVDLGVNKTYHIICRDKNGLFNTTPGETYTIGAETYARLRGESTNAMSAGAYGE